MATTRKKTRKTRSLKPTAEKGSPEAEPQIGGLEQIAKAPSEPKGSQVAKAPPQLDGIEFAKPASGEAVPSDADPRSNSAEPELPDRTMDTDRANQQAARGAIERMNHERAKPKRGPPKLPEIDAERAKEIAPKLYRVLKPAQITRGASTYNLPAGKPITNRDYDIESLRAQGVQLEEIPVGA